MNPSRFDIFDAKIDVGSASYRRPCILISNVVENYAAVVPVSSALELYRGRPDHFLIEESDADFLSTGLKRSSYAIGDELDEVHSNHLIEKRGRLEGELLRRFKDWID